MVSIFRPSQSRGLFVRRRRMVHICTVMHSERDKFCAAGDVIVVDPAEVVMFFGCVRFFVRLPIVLRRRREGLGLWFRELLVVVWV